MTDLAHSKSKARQSLFGGSHSSIAPGPLPTVLIEIPYRRLPKNSSQRPETAEQTLHVPSRQSRVRLHACSLNSRCSDLFREQPSNKLGRPWKKARDRHKK